jgi:opacity protein-like surface antigen
VSRISVSAIAILCTASLPALAGPLDAPPAPPPVVIETALDPAFAGAYAGLSFGPIWGDIRDFPPLPLPEYENGTAFGGFAGFNLQRGNLVFGGEARYLAFDGFAPASPFPGLPNGIVGATAFGDDDDDDYDYDDDYDDKDGGNDDPPFDGWPDDVWTDGFGENPTIDHVFDLRGRAGFVRGAAFFYAAAGWSWSELSIPFAAAPLDVDGWNAGFGVEMNLTDRYFIGADYTMRELTGTLSGIDYEADLNTLTLRAGLRF